MNRIAVLVLCFAMGAGAQSTSVGKNQYVARCAGCHGEDGSGGGHGPAIVGVRQPKANSPEAVRAVILHGIAGTGMPAFQLEEDELGAIAGFVMGLKSPGAERISSSAVDGDAAAGGRFFYGKGACSGCHMLGGHGGVMGPDLSGVGGRRTAAQLEKALREPGSGGGGRGAAVYRAVRVRFRDGKEIHGIAKNESRFDLQLLGLDGQLHLLQKRDVAEVAPERSVMPPVVASAVEMRDLVAFLREPIGRAAAGVEGGVSFSDIAKPAAGTWPSYNGRLDGNRYSPLTQINTGNVERMAPKWMFTLQGAPRNLQMTPVVVGGVMYVTSVNEAYALDARNGREIWHYSRPRTARLAGDAASGINRGVAVLGDRVFMATDNAHVIALHRLTGQLLWDATMADSRVNYGATSAPLVVNDLVIAGVSGGDEGVRGFLDAYRASTGERVWRFWTIPAPGEPGAETWKGRAIEHGCGTTWLTGTFDPDSGLVYWPTGNPCPDYNGGERVGDNLYTSSVLALEPKSGTLKWHYQFTPHDLHDWDAVQTPVLVNAMFHGERRKLLLQGNRNGFFYVLDRITGKVLLAEPFVKELTWASGIGADGRPKLLPGNEPTVEGQMTCPAVAGAANWPSPAFSPVTGLFYLFAEESCDIYSKNEEWWKAGESFYGGATRGVPGRKEGGKFLRALDVQTGKTVWEIGEIGGGILGSGLMATAGGIVFFGDGNGAFLAADSKNGKLLWHFSTGISSRASPMSYSIDGTQYFGAVSGNTVIAFGVR